MNALVYIDQDKKNASIPQQINFTGKLKEDDDATMLLLLKSSEKLF